MIFPFANFTEICASLLKFHREIRGKFQRTFRHVIIIAIFWISFNKNFDKISPKFAARLLK